VVKVPVPIQSRTHNFKIIDYIQRVAHHILSFPSRASIVYIWFLKQETNESAVTRRDYIAHFHLLRQGFQVEPYLLGLTVQVYIGIDLLLTFDVLLLNRLVVVLIDHLARPRVNFDSF